MSKFNIRSFLMRFLVDSLRNPNICLANLSIFHFFSVPVLMEPLSFLSLEKVGNRKASYFFLTNVILHYIPIHSVAAVLITSVPFIVTCCEARHR